MFDLTSPIGNHIYSNIHSLNGSFASFSLQCCYCLLCRRSQMIPQDDYNFITAYEQTKGDERKALLDKYKGQCARTFLGLMTTVAKVQTVRYVLTIIDDMLHVRKKSADGVCAALILISDVCEWSTFRRIRLEWRFSRRTLKSRSSRFGLHFYRCSSTRTDLLSTRSVYNEISTSYSCFMGFNCSPIS